VVQTMLYLSDPLFGLCTPEGANLELVLRVVVRYVDQKPDRMHERFEKLALEAVLEAWPCHR
jgi:Rap1a immunity proteins